jgi:hypothetical protein
MAQEIQASFSVYTIPGPAFIRADSANKMLTSYINSARTVEASDTNLYSVIFNADSLRRMLNDTNGKITHVKVMFAHTLDYINSGHQNHYCGYKIGALTVILAGFDSSGNYVYHPAGKVMDLGNPCPPFCPDSGTASSNHLAQ